MIYKLMAGFCALAFVSFCFAAESTENESIVDPYALTKAISLMLIDELGNLPEGENRHRALITMIESRLMPFIDDKYMSLAVLGKHLGKLSPEQRHDFHQAFKLHLVKSYAGVLTKFNDQKIEVESRKPLDGLKRKIAVKARILQTSGPAIDVSFKYRKNKKTGEWRVYDFVAEGISLLHTKNKEFSDLIRQKGFESVLVSLQNQGKSAR